MFKSSIAIVILATVLGMGNLGFAQTWQLQRHDSNNSSFTEGKGKITVPALKWRLFLGGSATGLRPLDADLDGYDDVLAIEAGAATARGTDGTVLWRTASLGIDACPGRGDVDGDQLDELLCRTPAGVVLVSTTTGKTVWAPKDGAFKYRAFMALADFDGDGLAEVAVANGGSYGQSLGGKTRIFTFKSGAKELAVTSDTTALGDKVFAHEQLVVDVDGDGLPDVFSALATEKNGGRAFAWSGLTGKALGHSADLGIVRCDDAVSLPQKNANPVVICVADRLTSGLKNNQRAVAAFQLVGKEIKRLWIVNAGDPKKNAIRAPAAAIGDLDGDGKAEVIASTRTASGWRLRAFDALSGSMLHDLPATSGLGYALTNAWSMAGSKKVLLLAEKRGTKATIEALPHAFVLWSRSLGFQAMGELTKGRYAAVRPKAVPATVFPRPSQLLTIDGLDTAGHLLRTADTDGDGFDDAVALLAVTPDGQAKVTASGTLAASPMARVMLRKGDLKLPAILLGNGETELLDSKLQRINDGDKDGVADLRYGGQTNPYVIVDRDPKGGATAMAVSAGSWVWMLDAAKAGPTDAPVQRFKDRFRGWVRANLADVNGDGKLDLLVRHSGADGRPWLTAFDGTKLASKTALWTFKHANESMNWARWTEGDAFALHDVNGDGAIDVIASFTTPINPAPEGTFFRVLDGKTGKLMWPASAECASAMAGRPIAIDTSGASPVAVASAYVYRWRCDLKTGKQLNYVQQGNVTYGIPMLFDLDTKPPLDPIIASGAGGIGAYVGPKFGQLWTDKSSLYYHRRAVAWTDGKLPRVVTTKHGTSALRALSGKTGKPIWDRGYAAGKALPPGTQAPGGVTNDGLIGVRNLDGTGKSALLFSTTEGRLYAARALTGDVVWSLAFSGTVAGTIAADLDGDNLLEVVVGTPDGYLSVLGQDALKPPAWVRENAGTGPALTDAADLDFQETTDAVHVNWAKLDKADGYAIRLLDQDGAVVSSLKDVGNVTGTTVNKLHLQPNTLYRAEVLGYTKAGASRSFSGPRASDGVKVVDLSAPHITNFRAEPATVSRKVFTTVLKADLSDKTRLASARLTMRDTSGKLVYRFQKPLATATYKLNHTWIMRVDAPNIVGPPDGKVLPAGRYKVELLVSDYGGHLAGAELEVLMCADDEAPKSDGTCGPPGVRDDGKRKDAEKTQTKQPSDEENGCSARTRPVGPGQSIAWLLLVLLATTILIAVRRADSNGDAVCYDAPDLDPR